MILECIFFGIVLGLFLSKRKKTCLEKLDLSGLWMTLLGGLIFYFSLKISLNNQGRVGQFFLHYFYLIHPLSLLLMAFGMSLGQFHIGKLSVMLGFLLNGIVILINGKMPVSPKALIKIGDIKTLELLEQNRVLTHSLMGQTQLNFFSDIIAYKPFWSRAKVMSLGDILIALGVGVIVASYISFVSRREE